ncbi:ABC transporter ATP-binding protein [Gephyromycinifex aptenodytis]|uniref:ABC transporter ATP-binding protein n=1 Tax=Gephyromycinifex aptenodytis TaxID=2716227 RepID=UPI00144569E6|nr:ABC transporter ATP-binding protein [Gephyromycinifex aptenodytis]
MPAIEIRELHKSYGPHVALRGIDVEVAHGEIYGFIGPNGAGKTTTMRILLDIIRASAGYVRVLGEDPRTGGARIRSHIGYLPGELHLQGRMNVATLLNHYAEISAAGPGSRYDWRPYAERLGLDPSRAVRGLSKGNKQKVGLVQAFAHRPELLILDEPTSGLDPLVQQEFQLMLIEARQGGQTVFLSSHVLSEIEHIADRVGVLRDGRLEVAATVPELRGRLGSSMRVQLGAAPSDQELLQLRDAAGVRSVERVPGHDDELLLDLPGTPDAALKLLARHTVLDLSAQRPDLETAVMRLYAGEHDDNPTPADLTAATSTETHDPRTR